MEAYKYRGLSYGGDPKRVEDGYISLVDFPVPIVLNKKQVYVIRKPLYIPVEPFGIPLLESSSEFSDWLEREGRETLLPVLLDLAKSYAESPEGIKEATIGLSQTFGI